MSTTSSGVNSRPNPSCSGQKEPNDQYLCIIPGRGDDEPRQVMLPFEGDRILSIVLSKAMLLANVPSKVPIH